MTFTDAASARFAGNVMRLRREAGFSQEVMADRSAVSTAMIGRVENGKILPYFDVVIRMAGALSTTPSALVELHHRRGLVRRAATRAEHSRARPSPDLWASERPRFRPGGRARPLRFCRSAESAPD